MTMTMENLALACILLPFAAALVTACVPQRWAQWGCTLFAAVATEFTLLLGYVFYAQDKAEATYTLLSFADVALFGITIDRVSTLIVFAVVFLGMLISLYSLLRIAAGLHRSHGGAGAVVHYSGTTAVL